MRLLIISLVLMISACGMRGDLYLPDEKSATNEMVQSVNKDS